MADDNPVLTGPPTEPPLESAPAMASPVAPEANDATGLRTVTYTAEFKDGAAALVVGEFADQIKDVWLIDAKGELVPVDSYDAKEVESSVGASTLAVNAKGKSGEQSIQIFITI